LEKNEVNLSSVSLVASILTIENKADLLGRIRNRSQKEVEGVVADYRPPVSFRDRARPVCVAVAEPPQKTAGELRTTLPSYSRSGSEISPNVAAGSVAAGAARGQTGASTEKRAFLAAGDNAPTALCDLPPAHDSQDRLPVTNNTDAPSPRLIPRIERKLLVQFLASEAFMKKFEKTRALLSNKLGKPSYEAVLETALDEFLKHHDPENRKQRREGRRNEAKTKPTPKTLGTTPDSSRHIPEATRDAVFAKDKGRCTYVGSTGKRCDATHNLQIDHVVPFARGGSNAVGNVRLLCARHNKLEAERVYGANTMRRFGARERTLEQFRASE
jgi:5-methylcytosine-specific restriction endonuclease McrA